MVSGSFVGSLELRPGARRCGIIVLAVLAVAALAVPRRADASGLYLPGRGVRPMGRGGAYVAAGGGNLNSIWYNPANLAVLEDTKLTVDTSLITTFSSFKRAPRERQNGEFENYPEVSNQNGPRPDPQLLVGGPTGIDGLTWAGGLFAPYAASQTFPESGPQRYALVDNSSSAIAFLGLSVAYEIDDWIRVGAGFQNTIARFELVTVASGYTGVFGRPEDRDLDIRTRETVEDFFAPTGNVGVWLEPVDRFEVALSAQMPTRIYDSDTEIKVRFGSHPIYDDARLSKNTVAGGVPLPFVGRLALRYNRPKIDIEVAGVFEGWSVFDELEVEPRGLEVENVPGVGSVPVAPLTVPKNWRDTFSVRVGGAYDVSEPFSFRAGYVYELGAVPPAYYSVFNPDANKHVFASGVSYDFGAGFEMDLSAAYYDVADRKVANSKLRQVNPIDTENELATVIGNGQYRTSHLIVGTGVNYRF